MTVILEDDGGYVPRFLDFEGNHIWYEDGEKIDGGWSYEEIKMGEPFLPFDLTQGTQNSSISSLKDTFMLWEALKLSSENPVNDPDQPVGLESWSAKTTQSITLTLVTEKKS